MRAKEMTLERERATVLNGLEKKMKVWNQTGTLNAKIWI